jgi:mannose-6-phosphate isomerase-like protein (cupin superfamily)
MRTVLTLLALLSSATLAGAQAAKTPRTESAYVGTDQMQQIEQKAMKDGKPAAFSTRLFQDTTHSTAFIRLVAPDTPHAHGTWSEVFVVREGSGVLETGGTITGVTGTDSATHRDMFIDQSGKPTAPAATPAPAAARRGAPGDLAGTGIDGGKQQVVKPGDVILIPAGVAHRWLKIDQPVVYLDIKFPKSE